MAVQGFTCGGWRPPTLRQVGLLCEVFHVTIVSKKNCITVCGGSCYMTEKEKKGKEALSVAVK